MKEKTYQGTWRSDKAEQKYREADAAYWARATDNPPTSIDVPTRFGPTRVYRWEGAGPAIVFIHGMSDTSIRWIPFAEELDGYDVYAVDIMGDVGQSVHEVGFTSAADYGTWLEDTIGGLGLHQPHVVGHSLGGFVAITYAIHASHMAADQPERLASLVAFDPVGMVKLRMVRFMAWGFSAMLGSRSPGPIRRWSAKRLRMPLINDRDAYNVLTQANLGHPPSTPPLPVFTDDELRSIDVPTWVIAGAKSGAFDVKKLAERATTLIPGARAQLVADAGHAVTASHFEVCLDVVREALQTSSSSQASECANPNS
jgi:pimeloyl-ACP methyl ester carboxylesterase